MNKIKYALLILGVMSLAGCSTPEELQREQARQASLTPRQKCMEDADVNDRWCRTGCVPDMMTNTFEAHERAKQCELRCAQKKNIEYRSCQYK